MRIELPLLVARRGPRLWEAWVPQLPGREQGPSLAALRDDLALAVMERFADEPVAALGAYQRAPHQRLVHLEIDSVARDQKRGIKRPLVGRIGVLLEKWPGDDFWVATPTRLPGAQLVVERPEDLPGALLQQLQAFALEHELESLAPFVAAKDEYVSILDVDVYPPSPLPQRSPHTFSGSAIAGAASKSESESALEREERRRRRRLSATTLRAVARNLSHAADDDTLERAFGREGLVRALAEELASREGLALVLTGPSGVGKTAVVHEVTRRLAEHARLSGQRRDVWRMDGGRFIAGMKYVGQWEARARLLCEELVETADVLHADDLASLVWAGRTSDSDNNLARFLEPHLARGELTVLAESTRERLEVVREQAPTFAALFRVVEVPALGERDTLLALLGVLRDLEAEGDSGQPPRLSPAALEAVVSGVRRFHPTDPLPGPAVRLLRRILAGPGKAEPTGRRFDVPDVLEALLAETGLPPFVVGTARVRPREEVRQDLLAMIAGQPEAVDAVADVVMTLQAGLGDPGKPLANLLFVGPTGVGKTETAKALARYLFGSDDRLVRFDMSELASPDSIGRLVGEAGGLESELAVALRSQPFRVILFDEVEKAHPRVFDALLQLLGEGRLTDPGGRTADARQSVIIMTSNLGVREAAARPGFLGGGAGDGGQHYLGAVRAFFRPEFFNRIDRIVPFRALDRSALRIVVEHALGDLLSRRGIQRGNVMVDVEPALLDLLVEQAYDPRYGARPLRRTLERQLTVPLAHHLVARQGEELALVELFGQAAGLGLGVRVLGDARPAPPEEGEEVAWTLERLRGEVVRLRAAIPALAASPRVRAFERQDAAADTGRESLLAEVEGLAEGLGGLDEEDIAETSYQEALDDRGGKVDLLRRGARGGLRARPTYREIPFTVRRRALERELLPRVHDLRARLAVLEHQLAADAAPCILLLECVGLHDDGALWAAATAALPQLLRPRRLEEVATRDGDHRWTETTPTASSPSPRRLAFAYEAPGARGVLETLEGWALVRVQSGAREVTVPVRVELLSGSDPGTISLRDARLSAEREARRRAPAAGPALPEVVTLRRLSPDGPLIAVATGTPVTPEPAFAAALLRAGRDRRRAP
jgi:ATP-dependent Clp protease ATP-binding subunit ClpC